MVATTALLFLYLGVITLPTAVADYPLNELSGTTAHDVSSNAFNGTLTTGFNAPTWVADGLANGLDFAHPSGGCRVGLPDAVIANNDTTVHNASLAAWVKSNGSTDGTIISLSNECFVLERAGGKFHGYGFAKPVSTFISLGGVTSVAPADSNWHLVVLTYDATTWKIYIDGVLDNSSAVSAPGNALALGEVPGSKCLGGDTVGGTSFIGKLGETWFYDVTLVSSDQATLFSSTEARYISLGITSTSPLPVATAGQSYSFTFAAVAGTVPYTWSVISGSLPTGLSLNASTGVLSGTPTGAVGTYSFTVQVTDALSATASAPFTLDTQVVVSSTSIATAFIGSGYSFTLTGLGVTPLAWAITSGSLPAGLSLNTSTGVISGTATVSGIFKLTIRMTDHSGNVISEDLFIRSFSVNACSRPAVVAGLYDPNASGGLSGNLNWLHHFYAGATSSNVLTPLLKDAQLSTMIPVRYGPFRGANDALYVFIQQDIGTNGVALMKSVDEGVSWTQLGYPPFILGASFYRIHAVYLAPSGILYVVVSTAHLGSPGFWDVIRYDTNSGVDAWIAALPTGPAWFVTLDGFYKFVKVAVKTNGDVMLLYIASTESPEGVALDRVWLAYYDNGGGVWNASVEVPGQIGSFWNMNPIGAEYIVSTGRTHLFLEGTAQFGTSVQGQSNQLYHISYDAANTFHTFQTIAIDGDPSKDDPFWVLPGQWSDSGVDFLGFPYIANNLSGGTVWSASVQDMRLLTAQDANDPAWSSTLVSNTLLGSGEYSFVRQSETQAWEVPISFNAVGPTIDLYWVHDGGRSFVGGSFVTLNQNIYTTRSTDGGLTWSAVTVYQNVSPNYQLYSVIAFCLGVAPPIPISKVKGGLFYRKPFYTGAFQ